MQQRPSPRRLSRFLTPATTLTLAALALAGCSASGTSTGGGTGGSGNPGSGGSNNPGGGTGGGGVPSGSGGGGTPTGSGGAGNPSGSGGSGTPSGSGGGGTPSGTGGNGTPAGTGGNGTPSGTGGNGTPAGTGGMGTSASGGAGGGPARTCPSTNPDMISDFEEGSGVMIKPRNGIWYDYKDTKGTQTPPAAPASMPLVGIAAEASGDTAMCNKWAMHVVGKGLTDYSGFGATFAPTPTAAQPSLAAPYDVSAYTGVSFKIKSGSGTPAAVYFGFKTKETAPTGDGGLLTNDDKGMSNDTHIGLRNNRGHMLVKPWIPTEISSTWQTITIPFGTLIPRWVPAADSCPAAGAGVAKCQAPAFNAADVLALEFSVLPDSGFPKPAGSTPGTYDIWVDDVAFVKGDMGLDPGGPADTAGVGSCTKPTGPSVGGKYLVSAYNQWKQTFVVNGTVVRPEAGNDTVSEGIAYGMLIAVNMNDKTLFDTLYSYWKSHASAGTLMTWCLPNGGNSCNAQGGGSATDADEDAAFALLQAGKVWTGGTYTAEAKAMIADIWSKDIDPTSHLPTGGSNYGSTSSKPTNPSYFAPSHYRAFKAAGDANNWDAVISAVYGVINGSMSGANGLLPAWCSGNCTAVASNGGPNDTIYQYDAHRIPMRIGMDYCWNGATASAAQTYTNKIAGFFATNPAAGLNGIGRIFDLYTLNGNVGGMSAGPNSASIIGTAAVAAMASGQKAFLNDAYQAVFDMVTRGNLAPVGTAGTPYSYYNATVGMLTLLIMTGNFMH